MFLLFIQYNYFYNHKKEIPDFNCQHNLHIEFHMFYNYYYIYSILFQHCNNLYHKDINYKIINRPNKILPLLTFFTATRTLYAFKISLTIPTISTFCTKISTKKLVHIITYYILYKIIFTLSIDLIL